MNDDPRSTSQLRTDYKALATLLKSRGWGVISETIEREMLGAARGMAHNANMPDTEMHFRRGTIYAAERLYGMPEALLNQLETAIRFREANEAARDDPRTRSS